jgi:hypothetical protein
MVESLQPVEAEAFTIEDFKDHLERLDRFGRRARRELARTAYHESGHAVAFVSRRIEIRGVAVRPLPPELEDSFETDGLDPFSFGMVFGKHNLSRVEAEHVWHDHLVAVLAGPAAEARYLGARRVRVTGDDRQKVDKLLAVSRLHGPHVEEDYRTLARLFVEEHWAQIVGVADALIDLRYLDERGVRRIIRKASAE